MPHTQSAFACASLGLASFVTSLAVAAPPAAILTCTIDGGAPYSLTVIGSPGPNGTHVYVGSIQAWGGSIQMSCNVQVDYLNDPLTRVTGTVTALNLTSITRSLSCTFETTICPTITEGSNIGGTAKITLTTDGPGALGCVGSTPIVQVLTNGSPAQSLFFCPFAMSISGSGSISSATQFGLPGPGGIGPATVSKIGFKQTYTMTPLDSGSALVDLQFLDSNGSLPPACPADLDGSGFVDGADIGVMFANWGTTNACPSSLTGDLNGDGSVNGADLALIFANWGPC